MSFQATITASNGCDLPFVAGQLQRQSDKIVYIKDYNIYFTSSSQEFPSSLIFEHKMRRNSCTEYYFRCQKSNSLYILFREDVKSELCRIEEQACLGKKIVIDKCDVQKSIKRKQVRK